MLCRWHRWSFGATECSAEDISAPLSRWVPFQCPVLAAASLGGRCFFAHCAHFFFLQRLNSIHHQPYVGQHIAPSGLPARQSSSPIEPQATRTIERWSEGPACV